jgi:hypothetical protein
MFSPAYLITCAEITIAYVVLQSPLAHLHGSGWAKIHISRYEIPLGALLKFLPPGTSSFVNPWAVEKLRNPIIFTALFAVYAEYNVVRAVIETHVKDGPDTSTVVREKMEDHSTTATCDKCGLTFRTRGLLRFVTSWLDH